MRFLLPPLIVLLITTQFNMTNAQSINLGVGPQSNGSLAFDGSWFFGQGIVKGMIGLTASDKINSGTAGAIIKSSEDKTVQPFFGIEFGAFYSQKVGELVGGSTLMGAVYDFNDRLGVYSRIKFSYAENEGGTLNHSSGAVGIRIKLKPPKKDT